MILTVPFAFFGFWLVSIIPSLHVSVFLSSISVPLAELLNRIKQSFATFEVYRPVIHITPGDGLHGRNVVDELDHVVRSQPVNHRPSPIWCQSPACVDHYLIPRRLQLPEKLRYARIRDILDDRLSVIRGFLKKRYDVIRNQRCSSNPLAFTQGGFYKGTKDPDERVGDLVEYMTASFGITALDDATYLWTGKRMIEDNSAFAVQVLRYLQQKLNQFKAEDHYLYAIYGTPAESLCATQARQYSDYCKEMALDNEFEACFIYW